MVIIKVVVGRKLFNRFLGFPYRLYKNDKNYVPELRIAQREVLNRKKNPFFQHAEAEYFLAIDETGKVAGRIAAITNERYVAHWNENFGFFGFFECVDNKKVANALFDSALNWLREKGVDGVYGPMNPSTNDQCGTLIDGFDTPPYIMMVHNKPYYNDLFINYGLSPKMDLLSYHLIRDEVSERMLGLAKKIEERLNKRGIKIRQVNFKDIKAETPKLLHIYNKAWEKNWGFIPMTPVEFEKLVKELKMVTSPDLVYIVEDMGEPIAFVACLPNINEVIIKIRNGRLLPFNFLKLIGFKKKVKSLRVLTLGILEKYRKTGIDACLYAKSFEGALKLGYKEAEASWILENNLMMNRALENVNGRVYKKYRIYQYNFSDSK
ncbi:MAG: hypothetical protein H8E34_00650 [Bacteroidetes bacterium]|nr:hypothetical protein [Bacteroidota bacterium]MBL6944116.1 hypothetical protein [Bacteroidales bacterium]